jgi:hypothetical protein
LARPRSAFASAGDRIFEDHAATDKAQVAARVEPSHGMLTQQTTGQGQIGFEFANAGSIDQVRQRAVSKRLRKADVRLPIYSLSKSQDHSFCGTFS